MLDRIRQRSREESGFTLVELLVVMLILGILAAIAVPSFFNQRDKAKDADSKSLARTAETAMETYATDSGGEYTGATPAALVAIESTLQNADLDGDGTLEVGELDIFASGAYTGSPGAKDYRVRVTSEVDGNSFSIDRDADGVVTQPCTAGGTAGCPTGGDWG